MAIAAKVFLTGAYFEMMNTDFPTPNVGYLEGSDFLDEIDHIVSCFDKTTKIRFKDDKDPQYIKFGSTRDNDANYNVRFGQLKLSGCASFFTVRLRNKTSFIERMSRSFTNHLWTAS